MVAGVDHEHFAGNRARGIAQQAVVIQRRVPACQVVDAGINAAITQHRAGRTLVRALPGAIYFTMPPGAMRHRLGLEARAPSLLR